MKGEKNRPLWGCGWEEKVKAPEREGRREGEWAEGKSWCCWCCWGGGAAAAAALGWRHCAGTRAQDRPGRGLPSVRSSSRPLSPARLFSGKPWTAVEHTTAAAKYRLTFPHTRTRRSNLAVPVLRASASAWQRAVSRG
ncbi:hypothetical protein VFPFJ_00374 [Purpureocillium lilacinum]|uniref:Uncharacterized protein n=1 Tax=Purpureocillium lilacinum TaxID=33203 RepID=A0A179HUU5_PURLI|nr:hypothetical protein VFPFJ_00374 [Purpureocillium lilacinum]OAQ94265.1 hypothetical protein VFPFJ_00374 [Purpureocillium lilacinum]